MPLCGYTIEDRGYVTPCHIWGLDRDDKGYGRANRNELAHRVAWVSARGPIPDGLFVCHHCDQPPCVNVEHLFLGTRQDNMDDCRAKGRFARGEDNGNAKLRAPEVRAIKARLHSGASQASIAREFGVSPHAIGSIARCVNWGHVA